MADVDDNDAATHAAIVAATDVIKMRIIIPRIHDDEDGMIILRSCVIPRTSLWYTTNDDDNNDYIL